MQRIKFVKSKETEPKEFKSQPTAKGSSSCEHSNFTNKKKN